MVVGIGADHAGYGLKERLKVHLRTRGFEVVDLGTDNGEQSVDYPVYAERVATRVAEGVLDLGVLLCGTGIGMAIAANKVPGIRAATVHDVTTARLAKAHNNANVLTMGARLVAPELAIEILDAFLDAGFEPGHSRRLELIAEIEKRHH